MNMVLNEYGNLLNMSNSIIFVYLYFLDYIIVEFDYIYASVKYICDINTNR